LETCSVAPKISATMSFLRQVWVIWNQGLSNSPRLTTSGQSTRWKAPVSAYYLYFYCLILISSTSQFAINLGVKFLTPEQLWLDESDDGPFSLPAFDANKLFNSPDPDLPILEKPSKPEMIILVGYPACMKTLTRSLGHIGPDDLGTWQKCVQASKTALSKGQSVVVDNTNMDAESRGRYIEVAKEFKCPVRCFIMETTVEHARHNERVREPVHS
uniref:Chromatin associated protein kti12 n=1 Tax=Echinostoma caproni TaxID=27848 RepID=A0A183BAW2_9TREM